MSALRATTPASASKGPIHLRAARAALETGVAKRLFLDRHVEFWLRELRPAWSASELRARVVAVIDETHDVKTFILRPNGVWRGHRAGQYVPVEVEIDGVRVRRCYSISSAPSSATGSRDLAITVKRVAGGRVSSWMHAELRRGATVGLGQADGEFVVPDGEATPAKLLLLSGGSGVTPVMSIVRDLAARGALRDVVFVHCARSSRDVPFAAELAALAEAHAGLRVIFRLDDDAARGPLDLAAVRAMAPDFAERDAFLCGPAGMMDVVAAIWAEAGVADRLRHERFVAALPTVAKVGAANDETNGAAGALLRLGRSKRTVVTTGSGTLLDELERGGERPAYGCRMGICNTCRCRKVAGTVQDARTGAVSSAPDEDIRLCTSIARGDVEIAI